MAKKPTQGKRVSGSELARQSQMNNNKYQGAVVEYGKHKKATGRKSVGPQTVAIPLFNKDQQDLLNNFNTYYKTGKFPPNSPYNGLNLPGKDIYAGFDGIENKAKTSFHQNTVPMLAERLSGLGSGIANTDPTIASTLGAAGAGLESEIAALRSQYGLQSSRDQAQNLQSITNHALQSQFDLATLPGQDSGVRQVLNAIKGSIPGAIYGGVTGGLPGAALGALGGLAGNNQPQSMDMLRGNNNAQGLPGYNEASMQRYDQTYANNQAQQNLAQQNPTQFDPMMLQNSLGNNAPFGNNNINQNQFNPQRVVDATVRGFGNRRY